MVCHGSHQYTPVMLAYIPAPAGSVMGYEDIRKLQLLLRNVVNILLIIANDDGYRWLMMVSNNDWLVVSTYPSEKCESQWEG